MRHVSPHSLEVCTVEEGFTSARQQSVNPRPSSGSFRTAHIDAGALREDFTRRFGCGNTKHLFCYGLTRNAGSCELTRNISGLSGSQCAHRDKFSGLTRPGILTANQEPATLHLIST